MISLLITSSIDFEEFNDQIIYEAGFLKTGQGNPFSVFTPFKNNALQYKIDNPKNYSLKNLSKVKIKESKMIDYEINYNILVSGGRKRGLKKLKDAQKIKKYETNRNNLSISTTFKVL